MNLRVGIIVLFTLFSLPSGGSEKPCLSDLLRTLVKEQPAASIVQLESQLQKTMLGRSPAEIENELYRLLDAFSLEQPRFPKEEFMQWMKSKPLSPWDIDQATKLSATQGDILNYRFQVFQMEKETASTAKKIGSEIQSSVKQCAGKPGCSQKKVQGILQKGLGCILGDKKVQVALLSTYLVQNASYLLAAQTTDYPYAWDLAITNALMNPIITEMYCRKAQGEKHLSAASTREQYQNLFLGKKNPQGVRPGFLKTMAYLQFDVLKFAALWAGTYKVVNTGTESLLYGKKLTSEPLENLSEEDRKNHVSINLWSALKESGQMVFFFDLPYGIQRNIFLESHLYTIALPHLIKNTALLFTTQSALKVGVGVVSTHIFQCWDDADRTYNQKFWDCFQKKKKEHPELQMEQLIAPAELLRKDHEKTS